MGRKKKSDQPDELAALNDLQKSLAIKLQARASHDQFIGLTAQECLELEKQIREKALAWLNDCVDNRSTKGTSVACQVAESMENRITWEENRLAAKDDNNRSNIREIKITYQEPDEKIVSKQGAGNDATDKKG